MKKIRVELTANELTVLSGYMKACIGSIQATLDNNRSDFRALLHGLVLGELWVKLREKEVQLPVEPRYRIAIKTMEAVALCQAIVMCEIQSFEGEAGAAGYTNFLNSLLRRLMLELHPRCVGTSLVVNNYGFLVIASTSTTSNPS